MKILFVKQLFNPEPTAKSLDLALELTKRGHEVQVLTGYPSYPIGKIYDGYEQKIWFREVMSGIEIIRVPIYPNQSSNGKKRILHYVSYAISATILGPFLVTKPDVIFAYQGAITVGIPALFLKFIFRAPVIYDINDMWPETVEVSGMLKNRRMIKLIDKFCNFNYRYSDLISVATPGFYDNLISKGVPLNKIKIVPNWSRDKIYDHKLSKEELLNIFPREKLNILYAGNIGVVQSLSTILFGLDYLNKEGKHNISISFLGDGADRERLKKESEDLKLSNIKFLDRVSGDEVTKYLNSADILLVHLKDRDLFSITIPSKILSYLRTGKPILLGVKGNAAEIIEKSKAGLCFEPENAEDFVKKLKILDSMTEAERNLMGRNGSKFYAENLSIEKSTDLLEECFIKVFK